MFGLSHLALRQSFNTRLTLSVLLIAISQFNFGFDQQGFASTQAMDAFARKFGDWNPQKKVWFLEPSWVAMFNGFNYIGQATGVVIGSYVSKRFGRRMCVFCMSIWAIVAATIVITSKNRDQILAARVLNYIYIGMELSVVPVYQSEVTPPKARGFIVGTYQVSLYLGGLIINIIARATGSLKEDKAFLIPYGLFYVVPSFVAACVWFIPESPRWLVMKDRREDALKSLHILRDGKFTDEEIMAEFAHIVGGIEHEQEKGNFRSIFRGAQLKRTGIVIGANIFLQSTGQLFTSIYGALFVKSLGAINPFNITIIIAVVNLCTSVLAMVLTDKLGRRFQLLVGASIQVASLITMGGLGTPASPSNGIKAGIIAMMVVSTFGYSLGWAPSAHILSAEIPSTKSRDMTYRTASVINIAVQFAVSFSIPYLLNAPYAALGSKVGFIFGSIAFVSIIFIYFCVPDVSGRSLEEIDWLFESRKPLRKFRGLKLGTTPATANKVEEEDAPDSVHIDLEQK